MVLAKVCGTVTCTIKNPHYRGRRIMVVQPIDASGDPKGRSMLALDGVQAGVGDTVVIFDEGGSARLILDCDDCVTVRTVIGAIVDSVDRGE
ncbi:MAG: EutN/CcmL family microcompartment protein [Sphaerochaeta sp.]|jgi:microcompartment protein CcmK/EutM|nr:EutN/CcmL family microcompartment protein [Sphaerochaeta sp.]MDX9914515.1 EutN/CcmL family microcompartment protein [Sphaerochaeta sp.]